ncbi:SnoaL-like domain protein [Frankia canadensis]|uniref:SnoaL-like domain protein n=1 Tax=Frankia canadensis TaxID=1836972 RepID=A0A2I2L2U0_9ACTN|nr:nuclear transport factor 2 family protein [Frankia canadensis]SNQ52232.1 SnoaL-like domain protein [Frankia canadensis]SOU59522.1 SnoaL-like domain protein [Frankia canadensis]
MLTVEDQLAIRRLADLYGYLIDERIFSRVDEVFTADVRYDVTDFGGPVLHGIPAVVDYWRGSDEHPLAHHAVNVLMDERADGFGDGPVDVVVKGLGVGPRGRVGSVTYYDVAVRRPDGWRLSSRRAVLRRPDRIPAES